MKNIGVQSISNLNCFKQRHPQNPTISSGWQNEHHNISYALDIYVSNIMMHPWKREPYARISVLSFTQATLVPICACLWFQGLNTPLNSIKQIFWVWNGRLGLCRSVPSFILFYFYIGTPWKMSKPKHVALLYLKQSFLYQNGEFLI